MKMHGITVCLLALALFLAAHAASAAVVADWSNCNLHNGDTCANANSVCCLAANAVSGGSPTCRNLANVSYAGCYVPMLPAAGKLSFGVTLSTGLGTGEPYILNQGFTAAQYASGLGQVPVFFSYFFRINGTAVLNSDNSAGLSSLNQRVTEVISAGGGSNNVWIMINLAPKYLSGATVVSSLSQLTRGCAGNMQFANWVVSTINSGVPVVLRFGSDMNVNTNPYAMQPNAYKTAFQNVVNDVRSLLNGTTKYQYFATMWTPRPGLSGCVNGNSCYPPAAEWNSTNAYLQYYPGDSYVDWVGLNVYPQNTDNSAAQSFSASVFDDSNAFYTLFSRKPMAFGETGKVFYAAVSTVVSEVTMAQTWWQSAFSSSFLAGHPAIKLVNWLESLSKVVATGNYIDYRLLSNPSVTSAFATDIGNGGVLASTFQWATATVPANVYPNTLSQGDILMPNSKLTSPSGTYTLQIHSNGNLALYNSKSLFGDATPYFTSGTFGVFYLTIQSDGNLVLYPGTGSSTNGGWGSSATFSRTDGPFTMTLTDFGLTITNGSNYVFYTNPPRVFTAAYQPFWEFFYYQQANHNSVNSPLMYAGQQLVSPDGSYMLSLGFDGNLVYTHTVGDSVIVGSALNGKNYDGTNNGGPFTLVLQQNDGNLVLYRSTAVFGADGRWASCWWNGKSNCNTGVINSVAKGPYTLTMTNSGMQLTNGAGTLYWTPKILYNGLMV